MPHSDRNAYFFLRSSALTIRSGEDLKPYNLTLSDIVSYSVQPLPFGPGRPQACTTIDPLPLYYEGVDRMVRTIRKVIVFALCGYIYRVTSGRVLGARINELCYFHPTYVQ